MIMTLLIMIMRCRVSLGLEPNREEKDMRTTARYAQRGDQQKIGKTMENIIGPRATAIYRGSRAAQDSAHATIPRLQISTTKEGEDFGVWWRGHSAGDPRQAERGQRRQAAKGGGEWCSRQRWQDWRGEEWQQLGLFATRLQQRQWQPACVELRSQFKFTAQIQAHD